MTPVDWCWSGDMRRLVSRGAAIVMLACLAACSSDHAGLGAVGGDYTVVSRLAPHTMERVSIEVAINFRCPGCYKFESGIDALRARFGSRLAIDPIAVTPRGSSGLPEQFYLLAKRAGKADLARSALYRAHFEQKQDIDNPGTIVRLGNDIGLPRESLTQLGSRDLLLAQQRIDAGARIYALYTPGVLIEGQLLVKPDPAAVAVIVDELLIRHR